VSVSSEVDNVAPRPIETSVLGTVETVYKPIAPVNQNDQGNFIAGDSDTYIDLDIKHYF